MGSGKCTEMAIITSSINPQVYIEALGTFLILSIKRMFGDGDIFQRDNAARHRTKAVKTPLQGKHKP